jgi:formylmethanofuran dehydrogenase subunit B
MAVGTDERQQRDVGCPFCGLLCDDLTLATADGRLRVTAAGCWRSREGFERAEAAASATVDGRSADLSGAIARAADILAASRAPVFSVAADIGGTRAVLRLADRLGGVVDHPGSDALFRNLRVVQDAGALTTTLSEVRNRADLLIIVGPDPSSAFPRFFERCVDVPKTLFSQTPLARQLFRLGPTAAVAQKAAVAHAAVTELPCALERLPEAVAALSSLLRGRKLAALDIPDLDSARLGALADSLKAARYATLVWAPPLFDLAGSELTAQALLELVRELNRTTRAALLPLAGNGNLLGVNQACTWQTGFPIRTAFGRGVPEHDPYRFSARRMVEQGEADALVSIAAFGEEPVQTPGNVPTIVLAPPGARPAGSVAAYIPVGTPGVDHAGQVFRTDGVVALRLSAVRAAALPDVRSVIGQIEASLANRGQVR